MGGGGCGSMLGMNGGGFVVEELSPCSWRCLACCLLRLVLLLSLLAVLSISGSKRSSSTGIVRYHRRSMVVLILAQCNNRVLVGCHVILHKKVINCGKSYGLIK